MNTTLVWCLWVLGAYLIGSIPFGLLIGFARGEDIRESGSGNVGATNAGRVLGRGWGFLCFGLDVCKGLVPTLGYGLWSGLAGAQPAETSGALATLGWLAMGSAAVFGHVFPLWLKFKGGKGVATGLGVWLGFWPVLTLPGVAAVLLWVLVAKRTGYVGLASVAATCSLPITGVLSGLWWARGPGELSVYAGVTMVLALLITVRHKGNLRRLRQGTEPKAEWAKKRN